MAVSQSCARRARRRRRAGLVRGTRERARRTLDGGRVNDQRFVVLAGTSVDAPIRGTDRRSKDRFGRAAYVWLRAKHLRERPDDAGAHDPSQAGPRHAV